MKITPLLLGTLSSLSVGQLLEESFRHLLAGLKASRFDYVRTSYAHDEHFITRNNGEFRTKDPMMGPRAKGDDSWAIHLKFFELDKMA